MVEHIPDVKDRIHLVFFNYPGTQGWAYRQPPWLADGAKSEFFSLAKCGSWEVAYAHAKAARDQAFARERIPVHVKVQQWRKAYSLNESGFVGVHLADGGAHRKGLSRFSWMGQYSEGLRMVKKGFSVGKYGFEEALEKAIAFRVQKTQVAPTLEQLNQLAYYGSTLIFERLYGGTQKHSG